MQIVNQAKGWLKRKLSPAQGFIEDASRKSSKYGVTAGVDFEKVGGATIRFRFENHILSTEKMRDVEKLRAESNFFSISDELSKQLDSCDVENVDKTLDQILSEAKKKDVKLSTDQATNKIWATAVLAKEMGIDWKTEYMRDDGHREKVVIEVPDNTPIEKIDMLMAGLGVPRSIRKASIERFERQNGRTNQNSPTVMEQEPAQKVVQKSDATQDIIGELEKGLKGNTGCGVEGQRDLHHDIGGNKSAPVR